MAELPARLDAKLTQALKDVGIFDEKMLAYLAEALREPWREEVEALKVPVSPTAKGLAAAISQHFHVDWGTNDINGTECYTVNTPKIAELISAHDAALVERTLGRAALHFERTGGILTSFTAVNSLAIAKEIRALAGNAGG